MLAYSSYMRKSDGIFYIVDGKENKHVNILFKVTIVSNIGAENNHIGGNA